MVCYSFEEPKTFKTGSFYYFWSNSQTKCLVPLFMGTLSQKSFEPGILGEIVLFAQVIS